MKKNNYFTSPFQWAGGKNKALPNLLPILEKHKKSLFIEPFVGAANVSLNFKAEKYIWNDYNKDLIDSYDVMFSNAKEYINKCEELFLGGFGEYYKIRDIFNKEKLTELERAVLFQYLNKHGFNGLCRYNKSGLFNVPIGTITKKCKNVPTDSILNLVEKHKNNTKLTSVSFAEVFNYASDNGDCLIYSDPPYVPLTSDFKYTSEGFGKIEHEQLKTLSKECDNTAIISNHWTPYTEELYSDADEIYIFDVQRTISSDGNNRKKVQECVVVYY